MRRRRVILAAVAGACLAGLAGVAFSPSPPAATDGSAASSGRPAPDSTAPTPPAPPVGRTGGTPPIDGASRSAAAPASSSSPRATLAGRSSPRATTSRNGPVRPDVPPSTSTRRTVAGTPTRDAGSGGSYPAQLLTLVNAERTARGLPALLAAPCPADYAGSWARRLASSGEFSHQPLSPIMTACRASRAAENIARGAISPAAMVELWMRSPGHRATILDGRLTRVGTSAEQDSRGTWTAVQVFVR